MVWVWGETSILYKVLKLHKIFMVSSQHPFHQNGFPQISLDSERDLMTNKRGPTSGCTQLLNTRVKTRKACFEDLAQVEVVSLKQLFPMVGTDLRPTRGENSCISWWNMILVSLVAAE